MNQRFKLTIVLAGALGLLAGCQTQRNTAEHDALFYWRDKSRIASDFSQQELSSGAMDPTVKGFERRQFIAQLFATYVKPGFTSKQLRKALSDTRWLDSCRLELIGALAGQIPVYVEPNQEVPFELMIFPDKGWSPWVIYLVFQVPRRPFLNEDAAAFITGELDDERVRLTEFTIDYPIPYNDESVSAVRITERFTKRGAGLMIVY